MEITRLKLNEIKPNEHNPRYIRDSQFKKLVKSLQEFPEMIEAREIVINTDHVILGGNMRYLAAKEAGIEAVPVKIVDWSEDKQREFIIKDNVSGGEWDWDILANEWDESQLEDWGVIKPQQIDQSEEISEFSEEKLEEQAHSTLKEKYIIPPMTVLDTRQGYWQERKRAWRRLIGENGETRDGVLFHEGLISEKMGGDINATVSLLDPVLCELICKWFAPSATGKTFDPFAGDTVFGYVSSYLGNEFTGIEIRQEQVDANNKKTGNNPKIKFICDDAQNLDKHIEPESQDLMFSCPPYFNLEVYSDNPKDASNQKSYAEFLRIIDTAFTKSIKSLKNNRFAVVVMSNVRGKDGGYFDICGDITRIFAREGMKLYNELVLVNQIGTGALRAENQMKRRKTVRTHQEVLVYYKGDPEVVSEEVELLEHQNILVFLKGDQKNIATEFNEIKIEDPEKGNNYGGEEK